VYCGNNPILFVDTDGKILFFAPGVSFEFKMKFMITRAFMKEKGTDGIFQQIEKSSSIVFIKETNMDAGFNPNTKTIEWDPKMGMLTTNGIEMSPATILNHEADHALQEIKNPKQKQIDRGAKIPYYDNLEEKRVITSSEQETARKHGEIEKGQVTRTDHRGTLYETKGPTTTESKISVIVYGTQAKEEEK
jgi:hypothetical protein